MKTTMKTIRFLTYCSTLAAIIIFSGCASVPTTSKIVNRINQPPPGKVLVNFHRPSSYGKPMAYPIFDGNGKMLVDMRGASLFQLVCDPGENIFVGWAERVNVVKADLAADKTYDIMVDIAMGWVTASIYMTPLTKNDPRREKLSQFSKQEKWTIAANPESPRVAEYEAQSRDRLLQIKKDFLAGEKSDRVKLLQKYDCR